MRRGGASDSADEKELVESDAEERGLCQENPFSAAQPERGTPAPAEEQRPKYHRAGRGPELSQRQRTHVS